MGRRLRAIAVCALLAAGLLVGLAGGAATGAAAETVYPPAGGAAWTVDGHGNGHGHGLSQYGARGAARSGLTATQIAQFFYPGTGIATLGPTSIRVLVTSSGSDVTVAAAYDLALTWPGGGYLLLPPIGTGQWRLVASGGGLAVQFSTAGGFTTYRDGLPAQVDFGTPATVRFLRDGTTSLDYRGTVGGLRSGGSVLAINRVALDDYARGVVPREMPSSWETAAVEAQTLAARSYGRYAVEHHTGSAYDICDTTDCQVYGGVMSYRGGAATGAGETAATDAAVAATAGQVVTYAGSTIFAQFSASDGGWTTGGGQPYLVARADPYGVVGGDPYAAWTSTVAPATVASRLGLRTVTALTVTGRDGNGDWGGRVTSAVAQGTGSSGAATSVNLSGSGLASALGVLGPYLHIRDNGPVGNLDVVGMVGPATFRAAGWTMDLDHRNSSTQVHVYVDAHGYAFDATRPRPDVQAAYGTTTSAYGFDVTVPVPGGTHTVCVYYIDLDGLSNTTAGCSTVTVGTRTPVGVLDGVSPGSTLHGYTVAGWAFDPDHTSTSIGVHVYVDATLPAVLTANGSRPDVAAAYGLPSAAHGYGTQVTVPGGTHSVCTYGIDVEGLGNTLLGCRTVTIPVDPLGSLDRIGAVTAAGTVTLSGWEFDPDASGGPGQVHVYVDSTGYAFPASNARADVAAAYRLPNPTVGYAVTVPVPAGTHQVCAYGINTAGGGSNVLIGCRTVTR